MKAFIIGLTLILLTPFYNNAQIPGYQGKRFFFEAGMSTIATFKGPTANNRGLAARALFDNEEEQKKRFAMSTRFRAGLYWTISRKQNLRVCYDYAQTGLYVYEVRTTPKVDGTQRNFEQDKHSLFYRLDIHSFNLGLDLYMGKLSLAPLGVYVTPSIHVVISKGQLLDQKVNYSHDGIDLLMESKPDPNYLNPLNINPNRLDFALGAQIGYRDIFFDRLILNIAAEAYLFPAIIEYWVKGFGTLGTNDEMYKNSVISRLQTHHIFNFHVGVGILIF